jgi:hypothetical protein
MIYGDRNYLRITLSLGIGLRIFCDDIYGEYVKFFIGNPELVKKEALSYIIIIPGENEPGKLAKQISQILLSKALEKTGIKYVMNEHLVKELLPGSSRIIEYGVGEGKEKCDESRFD